MSKREIMCTRYGEMCDMISCFAIYNGAKPKKEKKAWSFDEAIKLR
nr:MAG TPA: hypothetical protein [Caudoviricetes sp.]